MGLIKAIGGAIRGTMADQWKEYFYCDAMEADVLVTKGQMRKSGKFGTSNKGNDNIISNGSVIAVNEGQCMIIVDQGKVVEFCADAGEFMYDTSSEPSLFCGDLGDTIKQTFSQIGKRFTFGGDTGKDQRVYFFNTKEIMGNKYGTANPIPFRVVDNNIGLDVDISVRCNGEYSYKIFDPILFYTNVCGNVTDEYTRDEIDSQLKTELMTALQPAFARISELGIRYSAVPAHTKEVADALNQELSEQWGKLRGLQIVAFGVNTIKASEEDEQMIKEMQKTKYGSSNTCRSTGRGDESSRFEYGDRSDDGICRYEYGDAGRWNGCEFVICDGSSAAGSRTGTASASAGTTATGTASAAGSRRLDLLLRKDGKYWKILYGMWHAKTGRTSRLDLLLRNIESGEILHELWSKETGRCPIVSL